jgi:hypothetical protein
LLLPIFEEHLVGHRSILSAVAIAGAVATALGTPAHAAGAFANFSGSWSGSGQMRLEGGRTEALRCKAYYTDKSGGTALGISLRCASNSGKVELRANLTSNGNRVSGSWEERQFNASGSASGTAGGNHIALAIDGSGLTGSLTVSTNGARQTVSLSTQNVALKGLQISLARD